MDLNKADQQFVEDMLEEREWMAKLLGVSKEEASAYCAMILFTTAAQITLHKAIASSSGQTTTPPIKNT